jgi:hypothetical protein
LQIFLSWQRCDHRRRPEMPRINTGGSMSENLKMKDPEKSAQAGLNLRKISKQQRSFISMCVVAFRKDSLTDTKPIPPPALRNEIKSRGGNKKWIATNDRRLSLFKRFYNESR